MERSTESGGGYYYTVPDVVNLTKLQPITRRVAMITDESQKAS